MVKPRSQEHCRVRNGADVNRHIMLTCSSVYLAAAERRLMLAPLIAPGAQKIRLLLLEAVLGISDGVEAVLSSAADALIQLLLLQ